MTEEKNITTLVADMESISIGGNGWTGDDGSLMGSRIALSSNQRFCNKDKPRDFLSLSSLGVGCKRKLWYKINQPEQAESMRPNTLLKFFFGDMLEEVALQMARASGHRVEGMQTPLVIEGIKGHRDAVIDGVTIDVKSASPFAFKKFKEGKLRDDDPFGYISQLSSYVYAGKDDPLVTEKSKGGFLVIDKVNGSICLDMYDFSEELENKEQEVRDIKEMVKGEIPKDRIAPVAQSGTSPNTKLSINCSYCEFKTTCWPEARKFLYSNGPVYLVDVVNEPKVFEWTDET